MALNQIRLVYTDDLSPWLGGGFGMFSSTDGAGARHFHAYLVDPQQEIPIPAALRDLADRTRGLPSVENLERLASALAERESQRHPGRPMLRLEVWRTRHDPETLAPREQALRGVVVGGSTENP